MARGGNFFDYIVKQTSADAVPGLPVIEIAGDRRVLIENHLGVAAYGREKILVHVKYGCICICGCNLEMMHMTKEQLVIYGRIDSVALQRRR